MSPIHFIDFTQWLYNHKTKKRLNVLLNPKDYITLDPMYLQSDEIIDEGVRVPSDHQLFYYT